MTEPDKYSGGELADLNPPEHLVSFIGGGDFHKVGRRFVDRFKELCAVQPDERVLDVGCGVGRMAVPLVPYLGDAGSYEGLDILPEAIEWCSREITTRHPNFRFKLADVRNEKYNPGGAVSAQDYSLPYPDDEFDVAFAASVFTHLFPEEVQGYLSEIARVLKPGGRCLASFFLLNDESLELISQGRSRVHFAEDRGAYWVTSRKLSGRRNPDKPGSDVALRHAYREEVVIGFYQQAGLRIRKPIRYGAWSGRDRTTSPTPQDLIAAER